MLHFHCSLKTYLCCCSNHKIFKHKVSMLPEPGCGNPLFLSWIKEWHSQIQSVNKNYAYTLKKVRPIYTRTTHPKAIDALSKYPLPLEAKDTVQLNGIGPKIAAKLEQKWKEYLKDNPSAAALYPSELAHGSQEPQVVDFSPTEASTDPTQAKPKSILLSVPLLTTQKRGLPSVKTTPRPRGRRSMSPSIAQGPLPS